MLPSPTNVFLRRRNYAGTTEYNLDPTTVSHLLKLRRDFQIDSTRTMHAVTRRWGISLHKKCETSCSLAVSLHYILTVSPL